MVILPSGLDPDAFVQKEGVQKLNAPLDKGDDYLSFAVAALSENADMNSPAEKTRIAIELMKQIKEWNEL